VVAAAPIADPASAVTMPSAAPVPEPPAAAAPVATPVAAAPPAPLAPPPKPAPPAAPEPPRAAPPARAGGRSALATLEIISTGGLKGTKFDLHSALTNIGRGEHNDISIRDESISDSHAKLQKRGDGWWIVDQGSTNGTYVGGRRVTGEQKLEGAPDIRFGGIKMTFRPAAEAASEGGSTRAIAAVDLESARRAVAAKTPSLAKTATPPAPEQKKGCGAMIVIFLSVVGSGAGLLALLLVVGR
jgi:hypothetical protein